MNLIILDNSFNTICVVDTYESFIWTDRYSECGDFELYAPVSDELLNNVKQGYYIMNNLSEHTMIVESIVIESDVEDGSHIKISGRSLESILDRRIVWGQLIVNGNIQDCIHSILDACFINPTKTTRKVDNFVFKETTDSYITGTTMSAQYVGDNVYDIIVSICTEHSIGFKIHLDDNYHFVFELYSGTDRSYNQYENPYVVFSPSFDNIINSNYIETTSSLKNVALIGGEGEGYARKYAAAGDVSGLDRREIFADAGSVSSSIDGETLTNEEYTAQLEQKGREILAENVRTTSFEGECETTLMFVYGIDFFKGDIVQVANEYGHEARVRILEVIISDDESGFSVYPSFGIVE